MTKKMNIPFSPPDITVEEADEVRAALLSGWITTGPRTAELERKVAEMCNTKRAICLNSATACMEMALRQLGVGPGDEVIVPAYTYTATASVVCHVGAKVVFIDCAKDSYQMDYDKMEEAINERTKFIIAVDFAGILCDYDRIFEAVERKRHLFHPANEMQERYGRVVVMADAAHAFGSKRNGKMCGEYADFTSFSFHAVKNFTTGEGGALTWNLPCAKEFEDEYNDLMYKSIRLFALHGQSKDALAKTQLGNWEYDIVAPLYKCNMTDIAAAIGLVQMKRYSGMLDRRRQLIEYYNQRLEGQSVEVLGHFSDESVSNGHLYLVRLDGYTEQQRNELVIKMAELGVATNVHFKPLPMMTAYKNMGYDIMDFPNAYAQYANTISLPLYSKLTDEQAAYVMDCFLECISVDEQTPQVAYRPMRRQRIARRSYGTLLARAVCFLAIALFQAGCSVDEYISTKDDVVRKLGDFSFETTHKVMLELDYGRLSGQALVEVYEENPLANATPRNQSPRGNMLFSTFLGADGTFRGPMELPAHVSHVYFYSPSMAAPQIMEADVKGNQVKVTNDAVTRTRGLSHSTRTAGGAYVVRPLDAMEKQGSATNFYTIVGGWDEYGRCEDINGLMDEGVLTSDDVLSIEDYFWCGKTEKPSDMTTERRRRLDALKVDNVNMVVQDSYEENGVTYNVESAQVWFTFVTEYAWNENTVGYYYYDSKNPPKTASDIKKKFIILPNASKPQHYPFTKFNSFSYMETKAPTQINQRIQLLYVNEKTGKVSKDFPPGIEIGFFLMSNGFKNGSVDGDNMTINGYTYHTRRQGRIDTNSTTYYSNKALNGNTDRYVAIRLQNGTVVYGVEDSTDGSYDDMMFTITASPNKAIHTNDEGGKNTLTEIPQKTTEYRYTEDRSQNFSYAFEDIWPNGGDYDLNDVLVRHSRVITKDQFDNVSKIVDQFTFDVSETTKSKDAFAFQVNPSHAGEYVLPEGAWYEKETGTFFLTDDAHKLNSKTVSITRLIRHPVSFAQICEELNPFIVNQSLGPDCTANDRIEIHLPMGEVTGKGLHIDNVKNPAKAWYISDDGQYPYALKLPVTTFDPCEPGVRIGSGNGSYPNFNKWVESLGQRYVDWYKNK